MAVKTVSFSAIAVQDRAFKRAVDEASIAFGLQHDNIVATLTHELKPVQDNACGIDAAELRTWKLTLVQARYSSYILPYKGVWTINLSRLVAG